MYLIFQFRHYPIVHPEMVDCGSDQGRSDFETAGVARLCRGFQKSENADMDRKMPFPDGHYHSLIQHAADQILQN
jgi:hypothetical protein